MDTRRKPSGEMSNPDNQQLLLTLSLRVNCLNLYPGCTSQSADRCWWPQNAPPHLTHRDSDIIILGQGVVAFSLFLTALQVAQKGRQRGEPLAWSSGSQLEVISCPQGTFCNIWSHFWFYIYTHTWSFSGGSVVKNLLAIQEAQVWSLGWEDPLKKEMATQPNILAWEMP